MIEKASNPVQRRFTNWVYNHWSFRSPTPKDSMQILSVGTAFPPYQYTQAQVGETLLERWRDKLPEPRLLTRLFANCGVDTRFFVLPIERYSQLHGFKANNDEWIKAAVELGESAIQSALTPLGLTAADVSAIFFATVTGIASPTIDARLINKLPFPTSVKRTPIFGLGCVAGAAGIARAADYLAGHPKEIVVLLSVELCSVTWQDDDQSVANLISCGLFGDGCAAVVLGGEAATIPTPPAHAPKILATRSTFYRNTQHVMGWDICDTGFRIVLSPDVPKVVLENLRGDADAFLASQNLTLADISSWIFHSGGPKVLEAAEKALELPHDALALSWKSLREVGNLSAASVLCVLEETLRTKPGKPGSYSILAAMGPAFCLELVLLQW
jgi:alkylresorcinol/alkylpyrone synthase